MNRTWLDFLMRFYFMAISVQDVIVQSLMPFWIWRVKIQQKKRDFLVGWQSTTDCCLLLCSCHFLDSLVQTSIHSRPFQWWNKWDRNDSHLVDSLAETFSCAFNFACLHPILFISFDLSSIRPIRMSSLPTKQPETFGPPNCLLLFNILSVNKVEMGFDLDWKWWQFFTPFIHTPTLLWWISTPNELTPTHFYRLRYATICRWSMGYDWMTLSGTADCLQYERSLRTTDSIRKFPESCVIFESTAYDFFFHFIIVVSFPNIFRVLPWDARRPYGDENIWTIFNSVSCYVARNFWLCWQRQTTMISKVFMRRPHFHHCSWRRNHQIQTQIGQKLKWHKMCTTTERVFIVFVAHKSAFHLIHCHNSSTLQPPSGSSISQNVQLSRTSEQLLRSRK